MTPPQSILLVEDSRTQAANLCEALEREGWHVDWAPTVEAAMERLNRASPDLIMLDYYLPGILGDELCRRIRMSINTRSIPILMLTMNETHEAEVRGLESGADDFVSKSVDTEILLARIRALLHKSATQWSIPGLGDHRFRRARLLTIDDSATYQQYLTTELEQEGYLIERALTGKEGLQRILCEPFDCALVDLVMPDMSGIEVCRQVRELCRSTDNAIALLMVTGQESKSDLTQALEAGADDFVGKSSDMAVLKGRIRALLRRKFCEEDNRQVVEELRSKEVELLRARTKIELAEARAALNVELERRVDERTAQLAAANRDLAHQTEENEMLVYSVSHDLRSPLVNLQGFSHELGLACQDVRAILNENDLPVTAREDGMALMDGRISEAIHFIQTAVMRLSNIIDALLRLSRAGRVELDWQCVDANAIAMRVVDSMRHTANERGATITIQDLPPVWGDPAGVESVFANLIGNALLYLSPRRGGVIEVGCQRCDDPPSSDTETDLRTYYVKDNGLGIPAEHQPRLFRAFQRLHATVAQGEGIGLAIVRRTVERHGGKIWVESNVDVGTTFSVALPSAPKAKSTSAGSASESRSLATAIRDVG
ncbi:MAG TPA: response regulator [Pirellulales bacterium]|jgi:two-component system NtrC family sensor kinase|nr:response regulator [Pirellulales bacterium]